MKVYPFVCIHERNEVSNIPSLTVEKVKSAKKPLFKV